MRILASGGEDAGQSGASGIFSSIEDLCSRSLCVRLGESVILDGSEDSFEEFITETDERVILRDAMVTIEVYRDQGNRRLV